MSGTFDRVDPAIITSLPHFDENERLYLIEAKRKHHTIEMIKILVNTFHVPPNTAKFIALHLNTVTNVCNNCSHSIEGEKVVCKKCYSFNLNWSSLDLLKKVPGFYVSSHTATQIFPITSSSRFVRLSPGHYEIYLLGGSTTTLNGFQVCLSNIENDVPIKIQKTTRLRSLRKDTSDGVLATIPFHFEIKEFGVFRVHFRDINLLVVKRISLPLFSLFAPKVEKEQVRIKFIKKHG